MRAASSNSGKVLFDLYESTSEARAHWQAWWALANLAKPRFVERMERFPDFFLIAERAHFNSIFINLAHAFDKRKDVASIDRYLRIAKAKYSSVEISAVRKRLAPHAPARDGVLEIRNNVIAHKTLGLTEKEVFASARITPRHIGALVEEVAGVVNSFAEREGWVQRVFTSDRVSSATLGVLEAMEKA